MAYVGNKPLAKYATLTRQTFSTPTGTSHVLSHTVTNSDDLLLYINNVKQNPADYTASGTTLTTASLAGGTEMYCLYYGKTTETVAVPSDSVDSSHIVDDAIDSEHYTDGSIDNVHISGLDASKINSGTLPDARFPATLPAVSGASLTNLPASALTPMFYVYDENADISLTSGTATKVSFPDTLFDADNVFDNAGTDRFTIPSGQAGKYVMNSSIPVHSLSNNITDARIKIYKNGSFYHGGYLMGYAANTINRHLAPRITFIDDAAAADYYEIYVICTATSPKIFADSENKKFSYFYGYKIG